MTGRATQRKADRNISQSDVEWAWFLTHSLSFVITSWVIHVWLMREGAEESLKCSQVDWYVGKLGRKLLQLLGHWWHCRRRANWNKWNGSNECAAVSVFKWEQRWLEKLTMKAQGQNHDIIATRVTLPIALHWWRDILSSASKIYPELLLFFPPTRGADPQNSKQKGEIRIDNQLVRLGEEREKEQ